MDNNKTIEELVNQHKENINEIDAENYNDRENIESIKKELDAARKKDAKVRIPIIILLLICAIGGIVALFFYSKDSAYKRALSQWDQKEYSQAYTYFINHRDYKDSEEYAQKYEKRIDDIKNELDGYNGRFLVSGSKIGESFEMKGEIKIDEKDINKIKWSTQPGGPGGDRTLMLDNVELLAGPFSLKCENAFESLTYLGSEEISIPGYNGFYVGVDIILENRSIKLNIEYFSEGKVIESYPLVCKMID